MIQEVIIKRVLFRKGPQREAVIKYHTDQISYLI
jgi:hypothetical protein